MRICPKCRRIYEPDLQFCTADGTLLVNRNFVERQTLNMLGDENETRSLPSLPPPVMRNLSAAPVKSRWNSPLVLIALLVLLILLSGGFVFAAIKIVIANTGGETATAHNGKSLDKPAVQQKPAKNEQPDKAIAVSDTKEADKNGEAKPKTPETSKPAQSAKTNRFNGRVIMLNAILRTAPTTEADEAAILPLDAPVKIGKKAGANSPWYRVETTSGSKGWMHGNTIEFN